MTCTPVRADGHPNEASWDLVLHPSQAETAGGQTAGEDIPSSANQLRLQLNVTAATGTNLAVFVEDSVDGGATWNTIITFTAATGITREVKDYTNPFGRKLRVRWTLTGTTFTFTVSGQAKRGGF